MLLVEAQKLHTKTRLNPKMTQPCVLKVQSVTLRGFDAQKLGNPQSKGTLVTDHHAILRSSNNASTGKSENPFSYRMATLPTRHAITQGILGPSVDAVRIDACERPHFPGAKVHLLQARVYDRLTQLLGKREGSLQRAAKQGVAGRELPGEPLRLLGERLGIGQREIRLPITNTAFDLGLGMTD